MTVAGPSMSAKNHVKPIGTPPMCPSPTTTPPGVVSTLLSYYDKPGVAPPSTRIDPKLKASSGPTTKLWHVWKYGAALAGKGFELAGDVLSHGIYGPPRKTWGIEMTIISSIMRDVNRHSHLVDISFIRKVMSISGLIPLPSDALVTPVTFPVRRRNLRGILADLDAAENGKRELAGEWVVGKRLWRRLQSEWRANQTDKSREPKPKRKERVVLYIHGGAYYMFDATTHRLITIPLSKHVDARIFSVNYRLAPETQFPGPLHDVVCSYFRLIDDLHIPPENVIVAGDSAGGALCLALLMYLRDNKYPLPSAAMLFSPWVDLTLSCDSWDSNAPYDVIPRPLQGDHLDPIYCYLGDRMEELLTHPYASPLFGDFNGLPPILITCGDAEVLRDEITLLAHKATLAGVDVRHELYEDAVHVFQAFPFLESTRKSFLSCRDFVKNTLPLWQSRAPKVLDGSAELELSEEINNDDAKVVDADGMEASPLTDGDLPWVSANDEEDTDRSSQDGDSGWRVGDRESPWPSPPHTDDEEYTTADNASTPDSGWFVSVSSFVSTGIGSSQGTPTKPHSRSPTLPTRSLHERKPSSHRTAPPAMESIQRPAPRPLHRSTTKSHADISYLCQSWADNGPANRTVNYTSISSPNAGRKRRSTLDIFSPKT